MSERILEDTKRRALLVAALLSSDKAGEVGSAVGALNKLLPAGLTVERLVVEGIEALTTTPLAKGGPRPIDLSRTPAGGWLRCPWAAKARECLSQSHLFDDAERTFLRSIAGWKSPPSEKQSDWLERLHSTLREAA